MATASIAGCSSSNTSASAIAKVRTCSDYDNASTDTEASYLKQMMANLGTPITLATITQVRTNIESYCPANPTALLLNLGANYFRDTPVPSASAPTSASDDISPEAGTTSFANGQPSTDDGSSATSGSDGGTSSFTWADPNGYKFKIAVSFGSPGVSDPIANCTGGDAPPDTTNIPFTMTITNLLPDRETALPQLHQDLTGLAANPHPAGASAFITETDGSNCGGSPYELAGREQTTGAIAAGGSTTIQGLIYAAPTPITAGAAMTFSSVYNSATTVGSIPIPSS